MTIRIKKSMLSRAARLSLVAGTLLAFPACSADSDTALRSATDEDAGSFRMSLTVHGEPINLVNLSIESENLDPAVQRSRVLDVSTSTSVSALEHGLPAGSYTISLSAQLANDPSVQCGGSINGVVVQSGEITPVADLVLTCTVDGGQLDLAGGIQIDADVQVESNCGPLVEELTMSPLDPVVGESVALHVVAADGVSVAWSAVAGTIGAGGDTYTCPDVPGTYGLKATFTRGEECSVEVTQDVYCHAAPGNECAVAPEMFAIAGDCDLPSTCHLEQNGCSWTAICGWDSLSGEGLGGEEFPFYDPDNDQFCTGSVVNGHWQGTCRDSAGDSCEYWTVDDTPPEPACADLPQLITEVSICGQQYDSCTLIQDGCDYQINCGDGAYYAAGDVVGEGMGQWHNNAGTWFLCDGDFDENGVMRGECDEFNGEGSNTCEFNLTADLTNTSECVDVMPSEGFGLEGCGLDGMCFAVQRGCAWQVTCQGHQLSGVDDGSGTFSFDHGDQNCVGQVVNGEFVGSCTGGAGGACNFAPVDVATDNSCFQMPPEISTGGCGTFFDCSVMQDGCEFFAHCEEGQYKFYGDVSATGIAFNGIGPYYCEAELNDTSDRLLGNCSRTNPDGSVRQCFDATDWLGAPLVIDWEQP